MLCYISYRSFLFCYSVVELFSYDFNKMLLYLLYCNEDFFDSFCARGLFKVK